MWVSLNFQGVYQQHTNKLTRAGAPDSRLYPISMYVDTYLT